MSKMDTDEKNSPFFTVWFTHYKAWGNSGYVRKPFVYTRLGGNPSLEQVKIIILRGVVYET